MTGKWKRGLAVVSSAMVLAGILAGCGSNTSGSSGGNQAAASNNSGGSGSNSAGSGSSSGSTSQVIQIDENQDFAHLDPALAYDTGDWEIVPQVMYNQLITYAPQSTKLVGDLATSWTVSPDGKTYTFKLRKGVTFWNGDPVTAQNFIDEFQRILTKSLNSPAVGFIDPAIVGADAYYNGKAKTISGITAPDPYTLKIQLTTPEAYFLDVLAMPFFSPVDMSYINKIGNKAFDHSAMGTGPFELASYTQGKELILKKNPHFYNPEYPKLDEIDIYINSNEEASALKFKQGTSAFISWNQNIDSADFVSMMNDPQYKNDFYKQPLVAVYYLALDMKPTSPIQNKLVRQAINMAIDKKKLVQLQNGRAEVANQILPPAMPGYNQNLPANVNYPYDPQKAKELLKQAGYPNGFTVDMLITSDSTTAKLAQSIQNDLAQIGITVNLKPENSASYLQDAMDHKYPITYTAWFQDFPDPYDFLSVLLSTDQIASGNNMAAYSNPTVDKELAAAAVMPNGQARYDKYTQIQNQILADAPWVPLYYPVQYAVVQPWIKGFYMNPVLLDPLWNLSVAPH
ncbi:MAG: ABC transporter substrate-binding protein [Alicyclobacillus sp.]|nr:ABC transporter substrate-binding protein [Alicyclobacillus sp.]